MARPTLFRRRNKPTTTVTTAPKPFPLLKLPPEVIDQILQAVLYHPSPIPVSALFHRHNSSLPPPCDYRILHSCRDLYVHGLHHYYKLNTFSISLSDFERFPDTMALWPAETGQVNAAKFCRTLHLRTRPSGDWRAVVRCLKGFSGLQKVVFDARIEKCVDEGLDGGMEWGGGWVETEASEKLKGVLDVVGVRVGCGGVSVGCRTVEDAVQKMGVVFRGVRDGGRKLGFVVLEAEGEEMEGDEDDWI